MAIRSEIEVNTKVWTQKKDRTSSLQFWVGEGGLEPPNGFPDRFTVCCNCHYATPPMIKNDAL